MNARRKRMAAVLGGAALAVATAGCGSVAAPPANPGTSDRATDMSAKVGLAVADPCRILGAQEAARLGVGGGALVTSREALGGQACRLTNFPAKPDGTPGKTYLVQVLDGVGRLTPDGGAIPPIEGLPADRGTPSGANADNSCAYVLDLTSASTPRRYLWVQYTNLARDDPAMNHRAACDEASTAASAAIRSLNASAG
jgi:hypothetical protein